MDVDSCMARLAQIMNDNEPALIAARAERYGIEFPHVIQNFRKFVRLYFPHITTFFNQILELHYF